MVHNSHVVHRRIHVRQDDPLDTPTAAGLTAASVAQTGATANSFVFNTAAATDPAANHDNVNFSESPTATFTQPAPSNTSDNSSDASSNSDASSTSPSAVSSSSGSDIPMGTVIGACLGALAGCILIILIGLWLYRRGNKPRPRSPSNAHKAQSDKERAWGKLEDDHEDKWEGKDGNKHTQKGVVSVGPMESLTMFKKGTPSMRTTYTYHAGLAEKLAMEDDSNAELPQPRPFLARVETAPPISWDGDTVGRDSFLSLSSNNAMSPGLDLSLPTPKLTSSEPHHWESAEVMHFDHNAQAAVEDDGPRGRASSVMDPTAEPPRKSNNNPFFGARMSIRSTHSRSHSRSHSRANSQSRASSRAASPDPETMPEMPAPPPVAYTREEKGKYRAITPPSPRSSVHSGASTITGVNSGFNSNNPFKDPPLTSGLSPTIPPIVPLFSAGNGHESKDSHDRALASLIAALGPTATTEDVQERLRVAHASLQPSIVSEVSAYTEGDDTLRESWPVPPSRPQPGYN
ncbi:hypothetical protein MVEN_02492000 [Mycena venus]|uniref:Uncharacterized protein n=1 Tax=Mycena venus TaxID=2733690 RepID=A0A8H6WXN5_9AGAR|nr:hypothetical protein MVEN_02492000 [Mycena venus]